MGIIKSLINNQILISNKFDQLFTKKFVLDGNSDYIDALVPKYLEQGMRVYDIGGGKAPYVDTELKKKLSLTVVGLDISRAELTSAPVGVYDQIINADITKYQGNGDADIVICQALLEHVESLPQALDGIISILKPKGVALIFVPSRNAVFARLNIVLPQKLKVFILTKIFPNAKGKQGFPAFYHLCTPKDFKRLIKLNNCELVEERLYYKSTYFSFFLPFYLMWRMWVLLYYIVNKEQSAETFSLVIRKI